MNLSTAYSHGVFTHTIEWLSQAIARAKALTAIGASADMDDYRGEILNNYFDTVLSHLHEADHACEQLIHFTNESGV